MEVAVGARAHALRSCYDPRCLTAVVATVAGRMLADGDAVPVRAGSVWGIGDGQVDLDADLAIAGMGISPPWRLSHAARAIGPAGYGGQPGWLEVVLSWPQRLIGPVPEVSHSPEAPPPPDVYRAATG